VRWTIAALVAGVIVAVPAGSAGAASNTAACGEVVATDLTLENDLVCINTDGLIVGRDNITIDLNGHTIECVAPDGYLGQCTGAGPLGVILEDPDPEVGIDTNGHSNVHVFGSGLFDPDGSGRVNGFDVGVRVIGGAEINIQNLRIAAQQAAVPAGAPVPAPQSIGILVHEISCPFPMKSIVHIGGGRSGENNVNGYNLGLWLRDADCVSVGWNTFQNARSGLLESHGILLEDSSHNNLHENGTTSNGDRGQFDSGIGLVGPNTVGNTVTANRVIQNFGDGISVTRGASGNQIDNNLMLFNGFELSGTVFFDAADGPTRGNSAAPTNFWNFNNQCLTQTTPNPPPGVCASDELPS
jgi:parallel beta-helix repeat protein